MLRISVLIILFAIPFNAYPKVSVEQQVLLKTELTPFGANRKGNEKDIPAWIDKTAAETSSKPLFTINASNYQQYKDNLSAGQIALFARYPESFRMPIYPSIRSFTAPEKIYQNTFSNALSATLNSKQSGFIDALPGIPFPIPESALEVYYNHISRWRGYQLKNIVSDAVVQKNGKFSLITSKSIIRFDFYNPTLKSANFVSLLARITAPSTKAGNGVLVLEPLDQLENARAAWLWDKGRRRTIRAPNLAYDQPIQIADSLRTADDTDMINGSPDRFNWQLLEKREIYIPYNNDRLSDKSLKYKNILQAHHINPEYTRYELHRVWVLRATLKKQWRHIYSQRDFYLDEDSWSVMIADQYDKSGNIWRVSMSYPKLFPQMPGLFPVINVYYDLHSQRYSVMGLQNERSSENEFNGEIAKDNMFTPAGLKRYVR